MHRKLVGLGVGSILVSTLAGEVGAKPGSAAGRYVARIEGQEIELVLDADGSGTLAGQPGTWQQVDSSTIILADGEGNAIQGSLAGDRITLSDGAMTITFVRVGTTGSAEAPATQPSAPPRADAGAAPFRPARVLPGKKVEPTGTRVSFTVPSGWQHRWGTTDSGDKAYLVIPPDAQNSAAVFLTYRLLGRDEARLPMAQLLRAGANQLLGQATAQIVIGPEEFTVGGKTAGRLVFQGQLGAKTIEGYLGGVLAGDFAYVVLGLYDAARKDDLRAGADTILASFRGEPPAEDLALKRQIVGCWQSYAGKTTTIGSSGRDYLYRFAADGTYGYRYTGSISVESGSSVSEKHDRGTFRVYDGLLVLSSEKGTLESYPVQRKGSGLVIGGQEYWACQ